MATKTDCTIQIIIYLYIYFPDLEQSTLYKNTYHKDTKTPSEYYILGKNALCSVISFDRIKM